jgi:carotenoid cleavage dioxygenase
MAAPNFGPESDLGFNSPMRFEGEVYDCEVEGTIPEDLNGSFYRVGPNRTYPQRFADDIPFNGDGMASLFRISKGACDFKQKYVKTQRYLAERSAKRALFGRYRNRRTNEPEAANLSLGTANTHIYHHAGKLMALKEDSPPVLIDPHTLETIDNYHTFDGQLTSLTFSAHPKIDGRTGELICYGYEAKGDNTTDIAIYSFDRAGRKTWEVWINSPYVCMMHDIAVTENFILIPTTGYVTSQERLDQGLVHWAYDASVPIYCAVVPRGGSADEVRWFQAPHRCIVHTVSARERGGDVIQFDFQAHDAGPFPFFTNWDGSPWDPVKAQSRIMRWTMNFGAPDDRVVEETLLPDIHTGLPRFDERFTARDYRIGFSSEAAPRAERGSGIGGAGPGGSSQLTRWDVDSKEIVRGEVGEGRSLSEVVFAPRSRNAAEGDGYLLAVANVPATMNSELVIMDAQRLEDGVLARVVLPFRAHGQVHGNWVPRWEIDYPDAMTERPA